MAIIISDHGSQNILNLSHPDDFGGALGSYTRTHEQQTLEFIKLGESQEHFQLILVMVKYIELPAEWFGPRIDTASEQECWGFMRQAFNIDEKRDDISYVRHLLLDTMRLYIFTTPKRQYHVIAAHTIQTEAGSN
jgi:hypothetical protein